MVDPAIARLQALFHAASELDLAERDAFVIANCGDDPDLKSRLLRLLYIEQAKPDFLDNEQLAGLDSVRRDASAPLVGIGREIGRFRISGMLGDGGMGRVYRARRCDEEVSHEVAIKLVRAELLDPALLQRFSNERRVLAALNHPGICRFIDAGTLEDGTPYVAMELVDGVPLFEYCDAARLTIETRLRLLRKVLAAVEYAHGQLVVHRDIKSSNVLVGADGEPKLLDFGIAKRLSDDPAQRTQTAERYFTPGTSAPEQLLGEPVGVACDVYALGALAYELLCGQPPFQLAGLRPSEVERQLLEVPPPPPSRAALDVADARARCTGNVEILRRQLLGDVDAVVQKCLRKRPQERYGSVAQLDDEIGRILERRPVRARGGERLYRASRFVARHRLSLGLSAGLFLTVHGAAMMLLLQSVALAEQRNAALRERDRAEHVVTLLQDSFAAADPAQAAGADISVRHVLETARPRIEAVFESQPDLYAALAGTLAKVELDLANDAAAAELAGRALAAARRAGSGEEILRQLLLLHGRALTEGGQHDAALQTLAEARRLDSQVQPDWAVAQGRALTAANRYEEAIQQLRHAVDVTAGRGPEDELATLARWHLSVALHRGDQNAAGLVVLDETLVWQRDVLEEKHPWVAASRRRRVSLLLQGGQVEQAVTEAESVLAVVEQHYGPDSAMTAMSRSALGHAYHQARSPEKASAEQRAALDAWRSSLGETHPRTIRAAFNLAQMLSVHTEDGPEAEALYRESLRSGERRFGADSNVLVFFRLGYARFLVRQDRWPEVLQLLVSDAAIAGLDWAQDVNLSDYLALLQQAITESGCEGLSRDAPPDCLRALAILATRQGGGQDASQQGSD